MNVLVTGGAGFIGSHVVDALVSRKHRVTVVDSLDPGVWRAAPPYLRRDVDYQFVDLRWWRPDGATASFEAVVHLAALGGVSRASREAANVIDANVRGTARLVEAMSGWPSLKRFVLGSSFSVYGSNYRYRFPRTGSFGGGQRREGDLEAGRFEVLEPTSGEVGVIVPVTEDTPPNPLETYGASKYMQELCLRGFGDRATILRFSSVYGDRLRLDDGEATIIAKLAGWIRSGETPRLFEDGQQMRDWVYVGDLVSAVVAILDGASTAPEVNICSGQGTSLVDACEILASVFGRTADYRVVGGYRAGDMRHCVGDASRLTDLLGRPPVEFREGARLAFGAHG